VVLLCAQDKAQGKPRKSQGVRALAAEGRRLLVSIRNKLQDFVQFLTSRQGTLFLPVKLGRGYGWDFTLWTAD